MIALLLHLFGLTWLFGHTLYWIVHLLCAAGAVGILVWKGYVQGVRGWMLAVACLLDWGTGLFVAIVLRTVPPTVVTGCGPAYGGEW